jgi:hypothetical protein
MKTTLRFNTGGHIDCFYTEAIDLRVLGQLKVTRATHIRFNTTTQLWEVINANSSERMFSHPSRKQCLQWEHDNLQPHTSTI